MSEPTTDFEADVACACVIADTCAKAIVGKPLSAAVAALFAVVDDVYKSHPQARPLIAKALTALNESVAQCRN